MPPRAWWRWAAAWFGWVAFTAAILLLGIVVWAFLM